MMLHNSNTSTLSVLAFIDCLWNLHGYIYFFLFIAAPEAYGSSQARVESELQLLAYATATAIPDSSSIIDLHCSSSQRWILNPLSWARDGTCILMDTSWAVSDGPQQKLQMILSSLDYFCSLVKDLLTVCWSVYFGFYSLPLIYFFILSSVPHCLVYCSFIVNMPWSQVVSVLQLCSSTSVLCWWFWVFCVCI